MKHTVIMPVLNGAKHIRQALDSALVQLAPEDEIIIVDNGCSDASLEIARAINDARIRIVAESTPGPGAARNAGLREARGDLVSFLDHDDLWPEGRNAGLLAALDAQPDADAAYGRMRVRFDAGPEPQFDAMNGALNNRIVLGVFIFRTVSLRAVGPFVTSPLTGSDIEFLLRFDASGRRTVPWDGDGLIYRRHGANITHDQRMKQLGLMSSLASHLARKRAAQK